MLSIKRPRRVTASPVNVRTNANCPDSRASTWRLFWRLATCDDVGVVAVDALDASDPQRLILPLQRERLVKRCGTLRAIDVDPARRDRVDDAVLPLRPLRRAVEAVRDGERVGHVDVEHEIRSL